MKVKSDLKKDWSYERDKFQPLNNLDQENINLEMQIKKIAKEVAQMEKKIEQEEHDINAKETELMNHLAIFTSVLKYPTKNDLIRRDFGTCLKFHMAQLPRGSIDLVGKWPIYKQADCVDLKGLYTRMN